MENDVQKTDNNQQRVSFRARYSCRRAVQTKEPATTRVNWGSVNPARRLRSHSNSSSNSPREVLSATRNRVKG